MAALGLAGISLALTLASLPDLLTHTSPFWGGDDAGYRFADANYDGARASTRPWPPPRGGGYGRSSFFIRATPFFGVPGDCEVLTGGDLRAAFDRMQGRYAAVSVHWLFHSGAERRPSTPSSGPWPGSARTGGSAARISISISVRRQGNRSSPALSNARSRTTPPRRRGRAEAEGRFDDDPTAQATDRLLALRPLAAPCPFEEGYTILLPSPMDMPFLLRFALEGLDRIDTTNCARFSSFPTVGATTEGRRWHGWSPSATIHVSKWSIYARTTTFSSVRRARRGVPTRIGSRWSTEPRSRAAGTRSCTTRMRFFSKPTGSNGSTASVARGEWTRSASMPVGPVFHERGIHHPGNVGTDVFDPLGAEPPTGRAQGGMRPTPDGLREFDSMLHAQYLDCPSGRVGVMALPPRLVHFSGTIFTYRAFSRPRRPAPSPTSSFASCCSPCSRI